MSIQGFYLMPHPPIVIPEIGRGEETKIANTANALDNIANDIKGKNPQTIIIVTPHGTMFRDAIALSHSDKITGNMSNFGISGMTMELDIDKKLTSKIYELALEENIPAVMCTNELLRNYDSTVTLDHGAFVPLYFINKVFNNYKLVHITYAPLSDMEIYKFGMCINKAVEELDTEIVFIASGDLSHRLKEDGPYDYSPMGKIFDREFLKQTQLGNPIGAISIDKKLVASAGECGRRSVIMLLGSLDKNRFRGELLSYEDTFGVGYGVMNLIPLGKDESKIFDLEELKRSLVEKKNHQKNPYVRLARESLTYYLTMGKELENIPEFVPEEMKNIKRGVFVSLKKHGELRGCIGTIFPVTNSLAQEVIRNAIEAGIDDPRFDSVEENELIDIDFSVDVLTEPEKVKKEELNPKIYGVIVRSNGKTGLLLPDLEGVDTVEEQLSIALRKANINTQDYSIERFEVIRHNEE